MTSAKIRSNISINYGTKSKSHYISFHPGADIDPQTLNAKNAGALDKDLMSIGALSLDQLMELAGLSVSQAGLYTLYIKGVTTLKNAFSLPCSSPEQGPQDTRSMRPGQ